MMAATILHEAEVELWDAVAYYEDQSHGLGLDFEAEVERSVERRSRENLQRHGHVQFSRRQRKTALNFNPCGKAVQERLIGA